MFVGILERVIAYAHINPKSLVAAEFAFIRGILDQIKCLILMVSAP